MDKTVKERMRRYRERKRNKTVTGNVTVSPESVTESPESVTVDVTQHPAILYALIVPDKRRKLEKVYLSLKQHRVLGEVRYGIEGSTFDVVGDLLGATLQ